MKVYYEKDANLKYLKGKTVAVIGYGSQGHAHSQNLRDSGIKVIVGELKGTDNYKAAVKAKFKVMSAGDAAKQADFIIMLAPDQIQAKIYHKEIQQHMEKGKTLAFAHGFNIHYGKIVPPKSVDVVMIAPKGPGHLVRRVYVEGKGVPSLIAVHQNPSKKAKETALAYARAIGGARAGVLQTTFKEETETDLFGEQAVLCGGLTALIMNGYETLVEAGYAPEMAYFECLHETKLIVDLIYEGGIANMRYSISDTAKYGDVTRGPRVVNKATKTEMKKILKEIQNGKFADEWMEEYHSGSKNFKKLLKEGEKHSIEKVGKKLRDMMSWKDGKPINKAKSKKKTAKKAAKKKK